MVRKTTGTGKPNQEGKIPTLVSVFITAVVGCSMSLGYTALQNIIHSVIVIKLFFRVSCQIAYLLRVLLCAEGFGGGE